MHFVICNKILYLIDHDTIDTNKNGIRHLKNTFVMTSFCIISIHNHLYGKLYWYLFLGVETYGLTLNT